MTHIQTDTYTNWYNTLTQTIQNLIQYSHPNHIQTDTTHSHSHSLRPTRGIHTRGWRSKHPDPHPHPSRPFNTHPTLSSTANRIPSRSQNTHIWFNIWFHIWRKQLIHTFYYGYSRMVETTTTEIEITVTAEVPQKLVPYLKSDERTVTAKVLELDYSINL